MKRQLPDWLIGIILLVGVVPPVIIVALIFAPEQIRRPSVQSEMLQSTVVPQLLAWGKSDAEQLHLRSLEALQTFDRVCYVWQYQPYRRIEADIGPVKEFSGASAGGHVPENKLAFIAVRGTSAYVAHIQSHSFTIGRANGKNCAALRSAVLVKEANRPRNDVLALLVERSSVSPSAASAEGSR